MSHEDSPTHGYLELILGPMKSGKTSRLIQLYKQNIFCNIPVVVINHSLDNRYHDELLSSHDQIMIPCLKTLKLGDIASQWGDASVVLINEGQFFEDLYDVVLTMVNQGKKVYVCGLDGDYKRDKFGDMLDLIPHCDSVYKLTSLCGLCKDGSQALFTQRLTAETSQTVVGVHNYVPVCRKCMDKTINKTT